MELVPTPAQAAWVIAADMGLGHHRAAYPLRDLGGNEVLTVGSLGTSTPKEGKLWRNMRHLYESLSRINHIPIIGGFLFGLLEKLEEISPYYPFRNLSKPTMQVYYLSWLIKRGLGKTLFELIRPTKLPLLATFFAPALAVDRMGYQPVYLVVTDTDINRVWVAPDPLRSNVIYLAPCGHALKRLKQYGVPDERIYLTGFPLPKENLGGPELEVLKLDLAQRLIYLDPNQHFWALHRYEVEHYLGAENCVQMTQRLLTLTFAVGGAGAQKDIGIEVLKSLKPQILNRQIKLNLVAGIRNDINDYFLHELQRLEMQDELGLGVNIIYHPTRDNYFSRFNLALRTTDILWTKPSELSFYTGLGIPIILGPPLGPHEHYNKKWVIDHRGGFAQEDPAYCCEWLFDLLNDGRLAQAAWDGFLNSRKLGTYKIEELITTGQMLRDPSPLKR